MTGEEATIRAIDVLEELSIPYILVGAFSASCYGIPRSTKDADFVVQLGDTSLKAITSKLGPAFRLDPQMSFETATLSRRHVIDVEEIPYKIELFYLGEDEYDQERFRRRCRRSLLGRSVWLPTAEDVVVNKLSWFLRISRNKDYDDARDVIAVQGGNLDWDYIHSWCERHGTRELLDEILRTIPPI